MSVQRQARAAWLADAVAQVVQQSLSADEVCTWFFPIRTPPLGNVVGWLRIDDAGRRALGLPAQRDLVIHLGLDLPTDRHFVLYPLVDVTRIMTMFAAAGGEFEENDGETEILKDR